MKHKYLYLTFLLELLCASPLFSSTFKVSSFYELCDDIYIDTRKIYHDSFGLTWIVSQRGICIYDGTRMKEIDLGIDLNILQGNFLNDIYEDNYQNLWISGMKGLIFYDRDSDSYTFHPYEQICPDIKCSWPYRVNLYKDELIFYSDKRLVFFKYDPASTLFNLSGDVSFNDHINSINVDDASRLWVSTVQGIYLIDSTKKTKKLFSGYSSFVTECDEDIYISSKNGVWKAKTSDFIKKKVKPVFLSHLQTKKILQTSDGTLWFGTYNGLYKQDGDGALKLVPETSMGEVYSLTQDSSGTIWVGLLNKNILLINENQLLINSYNYSKDLNYDPRIKCFFEDSYHNIWVGSQGGGAKCLPSKYFGSLEMIEERSILHTNLKYENSVFCIAEDTVEHAMYIGTGYPTWLQKITNYKSGKLNDFQIHSLPNIGSAVMSLLVDCSNIWIGTYMKGLCRLNKKGNLQQVGKEIIGDGYISNIAKDADDNLWLVVGNRIFVIESNEKNKLVTDSILPKEITRPMTRPNSDIASLIITSSGIVWVATLGNGIYKISPKSDYNIEHFTRNDGLLSNYILSIVEDDNGFLWVTTNCGLMSMNANTGEICNRINDYESHKNGSQQASYKLSTGDLLIGGVKGIDYFRPTSINVDDFVPSPLITSVLLFNKPINVGQFYDGNVILRKNLLRTKQISLSHDQNSLTFQFASTYTAGMGQNEFKFILEGYDKQWEYSSNSQAVYTNLSPGEYTFKVLTCNNDAIWGSKPTELKIIIIPPVWARWYAYVFYLCLILLFFYFYRLYIIKEQRRETEILLAQAEKEQIKKISAVRQQFFANVSHELRTPLTLIIAPLTRILKSDKVPPEILKGLQLINKNAHSLLRLNNLFLELLRKDQIFESDFKLNNLVPFLKEEILRFKEWGKEENIEISIHSDLPSLPVWFDSNLLEQILFNLLSNAIKNTPQGGSITVLLTFSGEEYQLKVIDTGIGIPEDMWQHIFIRNVLSDHKSIHSNDTGTGIGLSLTKKLVELHHWSIDFESTVNKGSTFTIHIPIEMVAQVSGITNEPNSNITTLTEEDTSTGYKHDIADNNQSDSKESILIVEDYPDMRNFLVDYFSQHYHVYSAIDGKDAIEILQSCSVNIVVSDIVMPEVSGIELCRHIKENIETSHIPVILLTAQPSSENKIKSYQVKADAYCPKPFEVDALEALVISILVNRKQLYERFKGQIVVQPSEVAPNTADEDFLCRLISIVEENMDNSEFTVAQLADRVAMNQTKLNSKLFGLTGQKANAFIRCIRLKRAAQLLVNDNTLNVTEVMYSTGFEDIKYFRKCFKEEFELTPSEYQKTHSVS